MANKTRFKSLRKMLPFVKCVIVVYCLSLLLVVILMSKKTVGNDIVEKSEINEAVQDGKTNFLPYSGKHEDKKSSMELESDSKKSEKQQAELSAKRILTVKKNPENKKKEQNSHSEKSETKMSDKIKKRQQMYKVVYDPAHGLIRSSLGGKVHLHSLSDLSKGMKMQRSSSKETSALEIMQTDKMKSNSINNSISFFMRDYTIPEEGNTEGVEEESSFDENPIDLTFEPMLTSQTTDDSKNEKNVLTLRSTMEQKNTSQNRPPKAIILWTVWRSGSTFLGDLLASANNNTFYSYEPLFHFGTDIFDNIDDQQTKDALRLVEDLLSCNAIPHPDFVQAMYDLKFPLLTNKKFYSECLLSKRCADEVFFSEVCTSSDLHVLKIIRLSLRFAASMLLDPKFKDLQIVYLARDPRPVIRSRRQPVHARWCSPKNLICHDPRYACPALDSDIGFIQQLQEEFPDRFFFVRYEDLATAPVETVEQLWQRLGLPITPEFSEYLHQTTSGQKPKQQVNDVTRDSAHNAFAWREKITWKLVEEVQEACSSVITSLGWKLFRDETELRNLSFPIRLS